MPDASDVPVVFEFLPIMNKFLQIPPVLSGRIQLKFYWRTCSWCTYRSTKGPVCTALVCWCLLTIEEEATVNWTLCCWGGGLQGITVNTSEFTWRGSVLA